MLLVGLMALLAAVALGAVAALGTTRTAVVGDAIATSAPSATGPGELPSLLRRTAAVAGHLAREGASGRLQRRLDLAGNPRNWGPDRVLGYKGAGLFAGAVLGLFFGMKHGFVPSVGLASAGAAIGLVLPDVLVRNLGEKRQLELRKGLPDAMDVLTVCVEAGLGFDAALGRVARNLQGPVAQECARVLQEMQFGKSRTDAMRALSDRTTVPEVRSFVAAVVQSGELGVSIGDVLREQSRELRVKRRQRAQEKAQKLQVKILLPLISCMLPAMFVVVIGPAVIKLIAFFGNVNQ